MKSSCRSRSLIAKRNKERERERDRRSRARVPRASPFLPSHFWRSRDEIMWRTSGSHPLRDGPVREDSAENNARRSQQDHQRRLCTTQRRIAANCCDGPRIPACGLDSRQSARTKISVALSTPTEIGLCGRMVLMLPRYSRAHADATEIPGPGLWGGGGGEVLD